MISSSPRPPSRSARHGAAWGFAWASVGMSMFFAGARADVPLPLAFGAVGFLAGTTFSGVLMLAERKRGFGQLSLLRVGRPRAPGTLALARMAGREGPVTLDDGSDMSAIGLKPEEERKLLG